MFANLIFICYLCSFLYLYFCCCLLRQICAFCLLFICTFETFSCLLLLFVFKAYATSCKKLLWNISYLFKMLYLFECAVKDSKNGECSKMNLEFKKFLEAFVLVNIRLTNNFLICYCMCPL